MEFAQSVPKNARHLHHVHFVNIDRETTDAMAGVMKSLYEKKHLITSQSDGNESGEDTLFSRGDVSDAAAPFDSSHHPGPSGSGTSSTVNVQLPRRRLKVSQDAPPAGEYDNDVRSEVSGADDVNIAQESERVEQRSRQSEAAGANSKEHASRRRLKVSPHHSSLPVAEADKDFQSEMSGDDDVNVVKETDGTQQSSAEM